MEPVASAVDWIRGLAKSGEACIRSIIPGSVKEARRDDPIEILKRLQREAFSDLMKLRDRQDKIERVLSLSKTTNRSPFEDARTRVKGVFDVVGAWFFADANNEQSVDMLSSAGIRTGIDSRFIFETTVRQKDALTAEVVATNRNTTFDGDIRWNPLTLAKVTYLASINDWIMVTTIPMGAQCRDFMVHGLSGISSFEPPSFRQYHSCAAAVNMMTSNVSAALAGLVSASHQHSPDCLATFGLVSYKLFEGTKVTFSGLWQIPRSPFQRTKIGPLAIPLFAPQQRHLDTFKRQSPMARPIDVVGGSITLMLDSELNDGTKIGCWVQKNHQDRVQWSVSLADLPDDELGWGISVVGLAEGRRNQVHLEGFLNFNFGKRFNLQPGLVYAMVGSSQKPVIMLRSNWTL